MSRIRIFAGFLLVLTLAPGIISGAQQKEERVFEGYISDSQCALNVHSLSRSHKEMLKSKEFGTTPADCVWYCVKRRGGKFVLQAGRKVYKLDDQNIDRELAAKKVRITGSLDEQTETIHVLKIEAGGR
ncbi:MAG TPA: DUF5818 domain-containing protein [Candidatus Acidoferrales bacterium]|nr:DUF5818 domain-containing protein [Candidatus Acidoferrales bacterium]